MTDLEGQQLETFFTTHLPNMSALPTLGQTIDNIHIVTRCIILVVPYRIGSSPPLFLLVSNSSFSRGNCPSTLDSQGQILRPTLR